MAKGLPRDGGREAFWREAMIRQRQSGLNARRWCEREGVREPAFYFWRRTILQRDRDAAATATPAFVPVALARPPGSGNRIIIRLRDGRAMQLPPGMDVRRVVELVHALESLPAPSLSQGLHGPARVEGAAS